MKKLFDFVKVRRVAAATVVLAMVSGCASLGGKPEDQVTNLANQRWQHLIAGDFDKAYEMATPSYRQLRDVRYYRTKRTMTPVKWLAAEVVKVECTTVEAATKCTVRIKLDSKPLVRTKFDGILSAGIDETWVYENGRWWMFETL
jgi:hypothetical protein